jgi:hypothetical protein
MKIFKTTSRLRNFSPFFAELCFRNMYKTISSSVFLNRGMSRLAVLKGLPVVMLPEVIFNHILSYN